MRWSNTIVLYIYPNCNWSQAHNIEPVGIEKGTMGQKVQLSKEGEMVKYTRKTI
jgi:hypothetical protein